MTSKPRPGSVRAIGARRLQRATVGMVVLGVGGVAGIAVHDAQLHQARSGSTSVSQGTTTESAVDGSSDGSTSSTSSSGGSSTLLPTQSLPQATSGGS